jgi:hypothetical protein
MPTVTCPNCGKSLRVPGSAYEAARKALREIRVGCPSCGWERTFRAALGLEEDVASLSGSTATPTAGADDGVQKAAAAVIPGPEVGSRAEAEPRLRGGGTLIPSLIAGIICALILPLPPLWQGLSAVAFGLLSWALKRFRGLDELDLHFVAEEERRSGPGGAADLRRWLPIIAGVWDGIAFAVGAFGVMGVRAVL